MMPEEAGCGFSRLGDGFLVVTVGYNFLALLNCGLNVRYESIVERDSKYIETFMLIHIQIK